jgi:predicted ATPase
VITEIEINNYKSITKLHFKLGRMNVFIGDNGVGKSNILEAIAVAAAAACDKLDNDSLTARGIRVTPPNAMRSAFPGCDIESDIVIVSQFKENFVIFSPEYSSLRACERGGQIGPLGINGEGLLQLLSVYASQKDAPTLKKSKTLMHFFGWFDDFKVTTEGDVTKLRIHDRYLNKMQFFDHRCVNEGFFFLLFYFALFGSDLTPPFFAIDNIEASLNPKMCEKMMLGLTKLAKTHNKQVLLTTHCPSVLDGLDLSDDEQRLFVVSRDAKGATTIARVKNTTTTTEGVRPLRLSQLYLDGALGC